MRVFCEQLAACELAAGNTSGAHHGYNMRSHAVVVVVVVVVVVMMMMMMILLLLLLLPSFFSAQLFFLFVVLAQLMCSHSSQTPTPFH